MGASARAVREAFTSCSPLRAWGPPQSPPPMVAALGRHRVHLIKQVTVPPVTRRWNCRVEASNPGPEQPPDLTLPSAPRGLVSVPTERLGERCAGLKLWRRARKRAVKHEVVATRVLASKWYGCISAARDTQQWLQSCESRGDRTNGAIGHMKLEWSRCLERLGSMRIFMFFASSECTRRHARMMERQAFSTSSHELLSLMVMARS